MFAPSSSPRSLALGGGLGVSQSPRERDAEVRAMLSAALLESDADDGSEFEEGWNAADALGADQEQFEIELS